MSSKQIQLKKPLQEKKTKINCLPHKEELDILRRIYLGEKNNIIEKELQKKINGYIQQDKRKELDIIDVINKEDLIEKLIISKLKCIYCKKYMKITTNNKRDGAQWTLDRIDNSEGHNNNNVVISCLDCNLKRRCQDHKKFCFTKQLSLVKLNK